MLRFRPNGTEWTYVSTGYRNPFDGAFNEDGEFFVYDADMEWDMGMPWYRPTRLCWAMPGSEFGWRNGTGKWPKYYEDSMPPVTEFGPGSPVGVVSGKGAKFPAKYQRAIYCLGLDLCYYLRGEFGSRWKWLQRRVGRASHCFASLAVDGCHYRE